MSAFASWRSAKEWVEQSSGVGPSRAFAPLPCLPASRAALLGAAARDPEYLPKTWGTTAAQRQKPRPFACAEAGPGLNRAQQPRMPEPGPRTPRGRGANLSPAREEEGTFASELEKKRRVCVTLFFLSFGIGERMIHQWCSALAGCSWSAQQGDPTLVAGGLFRTTTQRRICEIGLANSTKIGKTNARSHCVLAPQKCSPLLLSVQKAARALDERPGEA